MGCYLDIWGEPGGLHRASSHLPASFPLCHASVGKPPYQTTPPVQGARPSACLSLSGTFHVSTNPRNYSIKPTHPPAGTRGHLTLLIHDKPPVIHSVPKYTPAWPCVAQRGTASPPSGCEMCD